MSCVETDVSEKALPAVVTTKVLDEQAMAERDSNLKRLVKAEIQNGVGVTKAIDTAGKMLGMTPAAARTRWYLMKKRDSKADNVVPLPPRGALGKASSDEKEPARPSQPSPVRKLHRWTPEMQARLERIVRAEMEKGAAKRDAVRTAAKMLRMSFWAVEHRLRGLIPEKQLREVPCDLKQQLLDKAARQDSLSVDDIQQIADKAGVHYHKALSTLGALHGHGEVASYREMLANLRNLMDEKRALEARVAEAQQKLEEISQIIGEIKQIVAEH